MKKKVVSIALVGALVVSMGAMAGCGSSSGESAVEEGKEVAEETEEGLAAEDVEELDEGVAGDAKEVEEIEEEEEKAEEKEQEEEPSEDEEENSELEASKTASDSDESSHTLSVYCWDPDFNIPALEAAEKDYRENIDPEFVLDIIDESNHTDVETLITNIASTGESAYDQLADITLFQDLYFQEYYKNYPDIWMSIDDADIIWDNFSQEKLSYGMVDGVHYGVPVDSGTAVGAYRIDLLAEAGYTIDDLTGCTWDEFIDIGKDVYDTTGKYLCVISADGNDLIFMMLQAEGSSLFKDGEPYITENETLLEIVDKMVSMVDNNVLLLANSVTDGNDAIAKDRVAGVINGNWKLATVEQVEENSGKWEITCLPTLEGNDGYASNGGSGLYITAGCRDYDLAVDFLSFTFGGGSFEETGKSITYDEALENAGVVTTYAPAGESEVYYEDVPYFNNTPVYQEIAAMTPLVPTVEENDAHYAAIDHVGSAIVNIINGGDKMSELEQAETQLRFEMGLQ